MTVVNFSCHVENCVVSQQVEVCFSAKETCRQDFSGVSSFHES